MGLDLSAQAFGCLILGDFFRAQRVGRLDSIWWDLSDGGMQLYGCLAVWVIEGDPSLGESVLFVLLERLRGWLARGKPAGHLGHFVEQPALPTGRFPFLPPRAGHCPPGAPGGSRRVASRRKSALWMPSR